MGVLSAGPLLMCMGCNTIPEEQLGNDKLLRREYASLLRQCSSRTDGKRIHARILESGHAQDTLVGNLLVQMYGKCRSMDDAWQVFGRIRYRNVFSWTIMIAACIQNGRHRDAIHLFHDMDVEPDIFTFASVLKACSNLQDLSEGELIHSRIVASAFESNTCIQNALVTMYSRCGSLGSAWDVFQRMNERDVVSWSAIIAAFSGHGNSAQAIKLYKEMDLEGIKPNGITFINVLRACCSLSEGQAIHARIISTEFGSDVAVENALVDMYARCGSPANARSVFDEMEPRRDCISWTAMITAYIQGGFSRMALEIYARMHMEGIEPDMITFASVLGSCSTLEEVRSIHACIRSSRGYDTIVGTALVNAYGSCGSLDDARCAFEEMCNKDVASWNAMISACTQQGRFLEAVGFYWKMQAEGIKPNEATFVSVLSACCGLGSLAEGRTVCSCFRASCIESVIVESALVSMYGKSGSMDDARSMFNEMEQRDLVSWNAIITSCALHQLSEEAFELLSKLDLEGIKPDEITFTSMLGVCSHLGALGEGRALHARILAGGFSMQDVEVALVDMYGKCGSLNDATIVFEGMKCRSVVTWTALIAAHANHGNCVEAFELFQRMKLEGVRPNEVTFSAIFHASSHAGLLARAVQCFSEMNGDYVISPVAEHYVCLVDLLGRSGLLAEAEDLINHMPFHPESVAWNSLLASCRVHADVERGQGAFGLAAEEAGTYVLLSNIYAAAGEWDHVKRVRKWMEDKHGEMC